MDRMQLGGLDITRVEELNAPLTSAYQFFPDLTKDMLDAARPEIPEGHLSDSDEIILSFHSYIVKTGRYTILVDTCCGNDKERPSRPAFSHLNTNYLGTLAAAGCQPEDVDFVMCTHLHWDHIGWNTQLVDGEWVPTFPNAKYIMARREYEHWDRLMQDPNNMHRFGRLNNEVSTTCHCRSFSKRSLNLTIYSKGIKDGFARFMEVNNIDFFRSNIGKEVFDIIIKLLFVDNYSIERIIEYIS